MTPAGGGASGLPVELPGRRRRIIDPFMDKVEELVDQSHGLVRADRVYERLVQR